MSGALSALCAWMKSVGITWDSSLISIVDTSHGCSGLALGVIAASDIREGDSLCIIPKHACISIRNTPINDLIEEEELGGGLGLVLAVLHEMSLNQSSKWFGYLQALPPREYLPVFWSSEEKKLLAGTEAQDKPDMDRQLTQEDFEENVLPLLGRYPGRLKADFITLDNFRVAASYVASRAFGIDDYHGDAMVPLADIFNHKASVVELAPGYEVHGTEPDVGDEGASSHESSDEDRSDPADPTDSDEDGRCREDGGAAQGFAGEADTSAGKHGGAMEEAEGQGGDREQTAKVLSSTGKKQHGIYGIYRANGLHLRLEIAILDKGDHLEIVAASAVPAGTEVHNTYGEHGNAELVCKYGFALRENPFTAVTISKEEVLDAAKEEIGRKEFKNRCRFLEQETEVLDPKEEPFEVLPHGHVSPALFVALRVFGAGAAQARQWGSILEALHLPPALDARSAVPGTAPCGGCGKEAKSSAGDAMQSAIGEETQDLDKAGGEVGRGEVDVLVCCDAGRTFRTGQGEDDNRDDDCHIPAVPVCDIWRFAAGVDVFAKCHPERTQSCTDCAQHNAQHAGADYSSTLAPCADERRAAQLARLLTQRACAILSRAVQHRLRQYTTSIDADRELWHSRVKQVTGLGPLDDHQAAVTASLLLRLSEKEVLGEMLQAIAFRQGAVAEQQIQQQRVKRVCVQGTQSPVQGASQGLSSRQSKRQRKGVL